MRSVGECIAYVVANPLKESVSILYDAEIVELAKKWQVEQQAATGKA